MSTTEIERGEALWAGGRVVAVYDETRQAILQADVAIGATVLGPLDTVAPFNPAGGNLSVTLPDAAGPLNFAYLSVDYTALTVQLVAGPAVILTAGSVVRPDPVLVDRYASVREDTQTDPIAVRVPFAMRPWLGVGTRTEGQGEEVLYGPTSGAGYVLHDVLGTVPLLPDNEGSGSAIGDMPVGTVIAWPSATVPARWLLCNGGVYNVADYPQLAAILGSTFGGDGTTTFAVPNLVGRFPRGAAAPGAAAGADSHAHGSAGVTTDSQPAHDHGSQDLVTDSQAAHSHGAGPLSSGSSGSHAHGSAGSHTHGTGGVTTGGPTSTSPVTSGGNSAAGPAHGHNISGATNSDGSHGHSSAGSHSHGISGSVADSGGHKHDVTGRTTSGGGHSHNVTGTGPSQPNVPAYLPLPYVIKATPGGDPLADGTYIEVRDEGIPDVPAATALDFRGAGVNVDPSGPVAVVTIGAQSGVTDHGALTGLADDDHVQYLNQARGDTRYSQTSHAHAGTYEPAGAVATHVAQPDPHTQYLTPSEGNAAYEAIGAVTTHAGQPDPHPSYALDSEVTSAIGTHTSTSPHPANLNAISDVEAVGAGAGDVLTYRGGVWHPEPAGGIGGATIADYVKLNKGGSQSVSSGAAGAKVALGATGGAGSDNDPAGYWNNSLERLELPEGVWMVHLIIGLSAAASRNGRNAVKVYRDGAEYRARYSPNDVVLQSNDISTLIIVAEGQIGIIEFWFAQNSGANMTIEATGAGAGGNNQTSGEAIRIGGLPPQLRAPNITIEVAPAEGVAPLPVDGFATNIGGTITSFDWDWGDGSAHGTGSSASHTYAAAGTYTVTCTATGPKGSDTATATVVVS